MMITGSRGWVTFLCGLGESRQHDEPKHGLAEAVEQRHGREQATVVVIVMISGAGCGDSEFVEAEVIGLHGPVAWFFFWFFHVWLWDERLWVCDNYGNL